jgi:hypothetical protein
MLLGRETMEVSRPLYWNIGDIGLVNYILALIAVIIFVYALYDRITLWRKGKDAKRSDRVGERIKGLIQYVFGHWRVLKEMYPGLMHLLIFSFS